MDQNQEKNEKNNIYLETLQFVLRLTKICSKTCQSLKLNEVLNKKDYECLKICSQNMAIATNYHIDFLEEMMEKNMSFEI